MIGTNGDTPPDRGPRAGEVVDRRDVIWALIGACAAVYARGPLARRDARSTSEALAEWLRFDGARLFTDLAGIRRLGALYLRAHPEESSWAVLSRLLVGDAGDPIQSQLLSAVGRDWSSHQVAVVDGWLMARSEARLCATLYLEAAADT